MIKILFALFTTSTFAQTPTFNRDVLPIFQQKCQTCHRPNGLAPFALMSFADAHRRAQSIDKAVVSRSMPPWKPAANCGEFRADRSLSQKQIETIHQWVAGGAPEGNLSDRPEPVEFRRDWILGKPDVALKSGKPFTIPANGEDVYRCFVLPYVADRDTFISALEVNPDKISVVHHVLVYLDPKGESPGHENPNDTQPGYTCFGGAGVSGGVVIGGWTPGSMPEFLPNDIGIAIPRGGRLVMQIHYHPHKSVQVDQTQLGVHFAKGTIANPLYVGAIFDAANLRIPAGDPNFKIATELTLQKDIQIVNVLPHMHLLGKSIGLEAIFPDNRRQCLINISHWDFHWQGFYSYKNLVSLPKGTRIRMTGVYDNSEHNHHQFYRPPREIRWGERTVDEMFLSFFSFIVK